MHGFTFCQELYGERSTFPLVCGTSATKNGMGYSRTYGLWTGLQGYCPPASMPVLSRREPRGALPRTSRLALYNSAYMRGLCFPSKRFRMPCAGVVVPPLCGECRPVPFGRAVVSSVLCLCCGIRNLIAAVSGCVVHANDFYVVQRLCDDGVETLPDVALPVVHRDDNSGFRIWCFVCPSMVHRLL